MSMFRFAACCTTAVLAGLAARAGASTPEAWAQAEREAAQACQEAAGLSEPTVAGNPVVFDDASGQTAVVIEGRYPQAHMQGREGRVLCLYDRISGLAHVAQWPRAEGRDEPSGK